MEILVQLIRCKCLAVVKTVFYNDTYKFFKEGTISVNIEDLKGMLRCNAKDESSVSLLFTEEGLEMSIRSEKRKITIVRKLNAIDFELQEMPIDTLNAIKYPFEFEMTKDDYLDLTSNMGRYSEILGIETSTDQVRFSESGDKGSAEIGYKKDALPNLRFSKDALDLDSEIEEVRIADKKIFESKKCLGYYSLIFLGLLKSFCNVLDAKDKISFWLKTSHPLKTQITFKKLTNTSIVYYLAPRIDEEEDEDFEPSEIEDDSFADDFEPVDNE